MLNWESVDVRVYFRTMGIRLLRRHARSTNATRRRSPLVVIVSEAMASRVWPGQDPIGKRLNTEGAPERDDQWQTVVVASARYREIESPRLDVYVPLCARRSHSSTITWFGRRSTPRAVAATLKAETATFDRALTIGGVTTMGEIVARTKGPWRFNMLVFSLFGFVALGLSATGLFALIAYSVSAQRTREIGVRIALGADRADVIRMMLAEGAALAGIGVACGLIAAALLTRLLAGLLFGISATDPATFAAVSALLVAVAALASYLPARRAAAVDPLIALRTE